jgi:hypothetical protein
MIGKIKNTLNYLNKPKSNFWLFFFLFFSFSAFAQFTTGGTKLRLGYQTSADGLVWRGSLSDTASIQPTNTNSSWIILDTINLKFYSFDLSSNVWNQLPSGVTIDTTSLSNRINLKLDIADSTITLIGNVTGIGSAGSTINTTIGNGVVINNMLAGGISDTKLDTITTSGKVANSATTATTAYPYLPQNANTIVLRNSSGDFGARNISATNFYGLASTATIANTIQSTNTTGVIKLTTLSNSVTPIITVPDVNATIATINSSQTFGGTQTFTNTITGNISGNAATVTSVTPSNFASQTANTILAAPNGSSGIPTFRLLASADIPSLNYLPLTGGILTGTLSGTVGTFTGLNINNSTTEGILALQGYDNNTPTRIQFKTGNEIRRQIVLPTSDSNLEFRTSTIGGTQGGYSFYTRRNLNTEKLSFNIDVDGNSNFYGTLGVSGATTLSSTLNVTSNVTANSFIKSGGTFTQFLKADGTIDGNDYLTTSSAGSTYFPFVGGTLTGALNGTTGTFTTRLGVGISASINPTLFSSGSGDQEIHFTHSDNNPDRKVILRLTNNNNTFYSYGGLIYAIQGDGINQYNRMTLGINTTEVLHLTRFSRVGIMNNSPSYTLDVNGTLGVSGSTTLSSTLGVAGALTLSTTTATPTTLLGKDGSNVVGEVTTVAQTGLMTRGSTTATTGGSVATFDVTHNLGIEPTSVIVTPNAINGSTKIFYEIISKSSTAFRVQAFNVADGSIATNKTVSIYWMAIK